MPSIVTAQPETQPATPVQQQAVTELGNKIDARDISDISPHTHSSHEHITKTGYWLILTIIFSLVLILLFISRRNRRLQEEIRHRHQIEKALQESEERYDLALSVMNDGVWDWHLDDNSVLFDNRYYTMAGYNPNEFSNSFDEWKKRVHPDDFPWVEATVQQYLKGEISYFDVEFRFLRKKGNYMWIQGRGKITARDDEGNPLRFVGTHTDITERKHAENILKEREQWLSHLLNTLPNGVQENDINGFITYSNLAHHQTLGLEPGELVGKTVWEYQPDEKSKEKLKQHLQHLIKEQPEPEPFITTNVTSDGRTITMEVIWDYLRDADREVTGFISIISDITERKQTEIALRRAQKMEAIGQLTGGIAHDFNNILGIIIGNTSLIKNHVTDDEKLLNRIDTVDRAAQRAADLTKQLLGFSREYVHESSITDINQVINEMSTLITRSITPEVEIETHFDGDLWPTKIDTGDFKDALLNLVLNARDAMDGNGHLTLETRNFTLTDEDSFTRDDPFCSQNMGAKPGDYVQLSVSDSGAGISPEKQEQIFEPFFTTKEPGKGTGLGLSMVYGFTKRSGGYITLYSEQGIGSTFRIYLPRSFEETEPETVSTERPEPLPGGNEAILAVDDEEGLLMLTQESLEALGYRVLTASNGRQALQLIAEEPDIDLLFSDVVMPGGLNGYELAEQATAERPKLKVLLTSGYTEKSIAHNGQARFNANLLSKPYTQEELAKQLRKVLDE